MCKYVKIWYFDYLWTQFSNSFWILSIFWTINIVPVQFLILLVVLVYWKFQSKKKIVGQLTICYKIKIDQFCLLHLSNFNMCTFKNRLPKQKIINVYKLRNLSTFHDVHLKRYEIDTAFPNENKRKALTYMRWQILFKFCRNSPQGFRETF